MSDAKCDTQRDYPLHRGPHEFIEEQVERTPDSPALIFGSVQISYRELNRQANRLAHFLQAQGVGQETVVGVCLDRHLDSIVSLLAILKSGGTYLPLDPRFPKDRLAFMLADSEMSFLLTRSSKLENLPATTARVILLDPEIETLSSCPVSNPGSSSNAEHLAYLIYTSGSTGKPKGVMIPRDALVNFLLSMTEVPGIAASDTLLAVTTASFDISILEFLLPLMCGARIVIASAEQSSDPKELQRLLAQHAVTVMQATPTTWRMLIESGWVGKSDLRVFCGGEALTAEFARQLLPRCRELWNMYGPTETTIWSSTERITSAEHISLGAPIANTEFYVLDENRKPVPQDVPGELWIGGAGLARGYLNRPDLTAERFVSLPMPEAPDLRLYRTGDEVLYLNDGSLRFLGRLDQQVKLHGFRIELGEIESALTGIEGITQAVVILREDRPGDKRLVAYFAGRANLNSRSLLPALRAKLPEYMVPSAFVHVEEFPLTPNAKLDRKALPMPLGKRPLVAQDFISPQTSAEKQLAGLWCELLQLEEVGLDDSFFDLGGNSLLALRMVNQYQTRFGREIPLIKVFQYPTIAQLLQLLDGKITHVDFLVEAETRAREQRSSQGADDSSRNAVAVIGMAGRFPGAANIDQLWQNLCNSVESISVFAPEELGPGIDDSLRNDPDYIRARGLIEGADLFDAAFFGIGPLEAQVMDPQQRVFLELAQQALDNAGYDAERYRGRIGIFAGIGDNHYYTTNLLTHPDLLAMAGKLAVEYGNQKDYIALRTAYLLDLRGPAVSMNTACSTTLLTVDQAYRSLLDFECDIALSGGVDITVPQKSGFLYQEGGTFSKDGHCRPFDADATGTMFCDGAGIVVLKRVKDALADGDTIYAVIRGTGKNNNGARPASFLAPSVEGQAEAIAMALSNANVSVESICYVEAHGTGTPVGDPIEFEALRKVFESKTNRKQFCYLGSIKGNIGHPTNAAGIAGLIKTALVLHHKDIPPTLHFKKPNPKIDFASSPFVMADKLLPLPGGEEIQRASVSSFGFGGTNVHVIMEQSPALKDTSTSRPLQLLPISARTPAALDAYTHAIAENLESVSPEAFADVAYTFQNGRKQMAHRRFVVAADSREAAGLLLHPHPLKGSTKRCELRNPPVVFLFGGQGTHYVNMGFNLYQDEPLFRTVVDNCCDILKPDLGRDMRELIYPKRGDEESAQNSLKNTLYNQPATFVIEYALARFWQGLGIEPAMMVGHSIGEFVAATIAGVWKLEDALHIVSLRGRLMQSLPRGSMLAVTSSAEAITRILPAEIEIASANAPALCVVSGPEVEINQFREKLEAEGVNCRHLQTSHAFHSAMMDPILEPLRDAIAKVQLHPPIRPYVSTVTGLPITATEATDPGYWARHARKTVEFSNAIQHLKENGYGLFLECGPRSTMCSLTRQHFTADHPCTAIPTFSDTSADNTEWATLLFALGTLWQSGVSIDWDAFYSNESRRRIPLPTYTFERQRFWVDPATVVSNTIGHQTPAHTLAAPTKGGALGLTEPVEDSPVDSALVSRKDRIASRLCELLETLSGRERSQISTSHTFMEQGFDSLSLTQVAFAIGKEFSSKTTFSQLMNQWPNIDLVADHLDATLPADVLNESIVVPGSPTAIPSEALSVSRRPSDSSALEEVVAEQSRTIARLVTLLEKATATHSAGTGSSHEKITAAIMASNDTVPVSIATAPLEVESTSAQRGIFSSSRLSDRLSAAYNESMTLYFKGAISTPKMLRAIEYLVERHDALRASFDETGQTMRINPVQEIALPVTDFSSIREAFRQEELLRELIFNETSNPFNLPSGPLFRCQMVLLAPERAAVILTAHHVICDGWSLDVLVHDLCAFYSEQVSGKSVCLEQTTSYANYVRSVTERQHAEEFIQAGNYWYSKFEEGFPALVLPADNPRSQRRKFNARRFDRSVPPFVVQNLRNFGANHGSSFFAVLLSSLAILLASISRQRRFVIALPTAEQPAIGQPSLVGHCVNLIPFAVDIREGESAGEFLKRVQSDLLTAQENAIFTVASLLDGLHPVVPAIGVSPLSVGLTSIRKFKPSELPQTGFTVDYEANPKAFESFEMYLSVLEVEERLDLHCHYDINLFEELTIREWLTTWDSILQEITIDPSRGVLELARLSSLPPADEVIYTRKPDCEFASHPLSSAANPVLVKPSVSDSVPSLLTEPAVLQALLLLWRRVLDVSDIGADDDFFALGGHSIAAAQLFSLIRCELGFHAPLSILYSNSTPRRLASVLKSGSRDEDWRALVAINPNGNRTPLFLVHAAEGNVLLYRSLAAHLGADQPVFGLQSMGLDGSPIDARFEEVARHYVREIRQMQPHGPYLLGGYCLGGTLAFEMAQQLIQSGESVGLVALIETYNIRSIAWPLPLHQRFVNHFFLNPYFHLQNLLSAEGVGKLDFFIEKLRVQTSRAKVSARLAWAQLRHRLTGGAAATAPRRKISDIYEEALGKYEVRTYPGELTLILAEKNMAGFRVPLGGWGKIAEGGIQSVCLSISPRGSMVEPHVAKLASVLRSCLDRATSAAPACTSELVSKSD